MIDYDKLVSRNDEKNPNLPLFMQQTNHSRFFTSNMKQNLYETSPNMDYGNNNHKLGTNTASTWKSTGRMQTNTRLPRVNTMVQGHAHEDSPRLDKEESFDEFFDVC